MAKKKTIGQLHKVLWEKYFSPYIRWRDALKLYERTGRASDPNYAACCTCGFVNHWKKLDAGHYISRGHWNIRYDEANVNAQCKGCNGFKQSNSVEYRKFIIKTYGRKTLQRLEREKNKSKRFSRKELEGMIGLYKQKLEDLESEARNE